MAESIGVVVSVQGVVFAVQADGTERQIFAGDQVMAGEVIRTGPDARAEISIDGQGASFVLEGGQSWLATADTHQTPDDMDSSEAAADVDAIQAAILAGVDPTTVGEATAAGAPGAGTGGQGNEGSSFVTLTRTGEEVDPNAGYQTSTFGADPQQSSEDPGVEPLLTTAVSLTASSVTEDEPGIVVTVSLTTPGESDVTVTTNLGSVLIPAGTTTGVLFVETQDSDPYLDPDSIAVTVTGVSGGEFDEVDLSAAQATADIADTIDGTVLNLTAPDEVDEGTDLTYTATLSNAPQTDVQVTLSNGAAITILAGETSGSVTVPVQGDDVYTDGESLSVTVTGASGGNFEQLDVGSGASGSPVQTAVVDTLDDVTVDLSATDVSEDDPSVTFTATLSAPAGDEAVVVETSLGNITIAAGETSGTLVVDSSDPDVYLDPDTLEATINSVSGGSFESLVIGNGTAVADISDTIDTTTLNLSATEEVAEGGNITYSAVVDNPPQSDLTVELSNGSTITILAGATGGSVSVPAQSDDVYVDGETLSVTVVGTTGGNYEYLEVGSGSSENPVQTAVVDTIDDVTVDLTVADVTEDEAGVTFTATLSAPAGDQPVTIETNLGNITIGAGQSSGTLFVDTSDPDVYIDPDTISATITSASGGNFENLIIGNGSATADISDTIDTTTLNLSAPDSVAEGGTITYTATVSNPTQTELTVTLSNGETITIPAGGSSGSVSISAPADDIYDTGDVISVSVTQAEGGNYENLVIGEGSVTNPVETDVVDTPDDVTVNLTAGDVTEDEAGVTFTATLSAPAGTEPVTVETTLGTITIASGQSSGVLFVDTNDPDVYIDPDTVSATITSASGGSFENLIIGNGTAVANISDTIDTTTLNLSATNEVAEGGNITYSAVVDNPPQGNLTVELSNGAVITILSGNTGGSVSVPAPSDDVYVDGETLSVSVVNTTGGNYENLEVGTGSPESPVQTTVVDTIDAVTVDLSASNVTEDDAGVTFTATLSAPAGDQPVVVETSLGDITIAAGQSSGTLFVDTSDPDVYIDPDSISATITGASGGDFENLVIGNGTATANITDTIDVTTLTLAATPQVSEGGTITYTATVDNAPQGNLSVTLSNGVVITIASGATVGSASIAAPSDDVYNNSTTLTVTVDSAVGGNYEQLSVLNSVQTVVTDTPDQVLVNLSTASVTEDDTGVTFTATLTAPAGDAPVVVETTQGTITIAAGQSTGTLFVDTNDPDVYIDPDVVSATINSVSGGGFESLAVGVGSATANISDTIDPTTLSLSAPESVSEGGEITYTATVTNAPQSPLSINLSNGAQITIGVGQTSGSVTVAAPSDDVYVDEGSLSVNITSTLGGNYENLIIGNGEVSVLVEDTTDTVYAELSGESWVMEADGAELPHTITFVDENGAPAPLKSGETVTFTLAYQSTGEQPGEQLPPEDVEGQQPGIPLPPLPFLGMGDVEDEDFQVKYVEVTVTGNGGNTYEFANLVADDALAEFVEGYIVTLAGIKSDNSTFEDLQISPDNNGAVGVIEDEILHEEQPDLAYSFKLFAIVDGEYVDSATIAEDGGQGEYIVLAVDGNGVPLDSQDQPGGSITVYVGDPNDTADRGDDYVAGETITADVNDSFTIDAKDDALAEGSEQFTLTLGQNWTEASTYEDVDYDTSAVITNIVDENPEDEDNPQDPDVAYSFKLFAIVDGEYVDSATIAEDGGQGEYIVLAVDGNGVPLDSQDQPGGSISVYVGDPNDTADRGDDYVAGATITADVNDSFTIDAKDDALAEGSEQFTLTLGQNWTEASTYEDVDYDTSAVITNIVDENPEDEDNPQDPDVAYSFKLFAIVDGEYVDSATIAEDGGQGEYIVLAVDGNGVPLDSQDQPGGSITVYVGDQNDTADRGDDYVAGATITADVNDSFTIDAKDDDLAEGDEQFTLTLGQDWTEASTYEDVDYDTSVVSTTIVDDDNGTITVSAEIQVGENLITNGSFEQFPGSIADGGQKAFQSVDGWTIYSGDEMQIHSGSHNMSGGPNAVPLGAADGDYYMDMESSPNAIGIEQTISGLDAGNLYNLSFSVADKALADPGYYANNPQLGEYQGTTSTILEVYWNGGLVKTIHTGTTEWLEFSFDLEAQGGDNTLRFVEIGVDGDNHGSALDDIKLVDKAALLDIQGTVDNVSDGETVTLTITDGTNSQDVTTTVSGGQYTYNDFDITGWDETAIHVDAETTDTGGNKVTADTSVSKDITATVSDDSGSVTEDATATATGNVLDNDSDADTVLTVTGAGTYEGAYGTLILQANGDYTYTLNNGADKVQALDDNETVVDTFTYTAQDDVGNDHSANLVITINGADEPNVAPTSTNDSVSTPEGVNLTLSLNDFGVYADADNDALAAVKITALPVNGTLLLNSVAVQAGDAIAATQVSQGNLVFVPADSDTDADSAFQFQVQDAAGLWSGTYTTDVNIDAVADQPNVAITLGEPQGETPEVTDLPTAISHVKYMLSDGTTLKFEPYDANITDPTDPTQYIEAIETATGETVTAYYIKSANNVYDAWGNYVGGAINGDASNPLANQSDNTSDPDDYGSGSTYVFGGTSATYDYPVTVTASLNDTDGSESLTLWVTGVPEGATLQGASYNSEENRWELTTETDPEAETEVQLVLEGVPAGSGGFTLTATAVATETNPNGAVDTPTATNTATDRSEVPDVNDPPEFGQTSYSESYQENSATSVVLETVSATDPEGGAVSYAITANVQDGAGNDLFAIDSSGNITLTADGAVAFTNDYEASGNTHVLTVTAFDSQGNTADVQVTLTETNIADQLKQGDNTDNTLSTVGGDNDVLIGDAGGNQTNFDQGTNYNISLIVDTSGSMESRMALTEAALKNLADTLVNHSGSVNLQIVEFGSDLKSNVTFNDIDTSDLSAIESAIEALDDGSYTNYEAGFRAAEDWFSNQSNGYENMAFFLTDGEPNRYLDNSGNVRSGSDSSPEVMQESVEAFADLTALGVTVHGIGIGTGVSTGTLRYFDNTEVAGQETIVVVDEVLANFSGSGDPLDTSSDWTFSGTGGFSSYVEIGGGIFSPDDLSLVDGSKNGDPVVATSNSFSVAAGQVLRFDYDVEYLEGGDLASWSLERNDNGAWSSVAGSSALSGSGEVASQALAAGNYRLVFSVDNSSGDGGLLGGDDRLHIDNIELLSHVDAPYGQPQTVTDGDQLTAVLQGGNTVVTPHDVGDDILIGGDGDDIIFGDAVEHADFAGQGTEGLFNAIEQDEGLSNPSAAQVHQYLVDNEADLIFPASQGGDDELTGGRGNDLLIGGEGQDRFVWKAGDQGTEDHPAEDHVADFELGTDKLDLSDLFDIAAGKSIDDYLFAATEGGDTKLYVNTKGDFNGSQDKNLADQVITLDDQNTDLNTLINNNGLITD